jgi:hypothetical protein
MGSPGATTSRAPGRRGAGAPARSATLVSASALLAGVPACIPGPGAFLGFEEVSRDWGFGDEDGRGLCLFDPDLDGDLDLFVSRDGGDRFYENLGPGAFSEDASARGLDTGGQGSGCAAADVDRDGDPDLVRGDLLGPTRLLLNDGAGRFAAATGSWDLGAAVAQGSALLDDFDRDGWLDLLVSGLDPGGTRLFRNAEGRGWEDRSGALGVAELGRSWAAASLDADNDGLPEIYVGTDGPAPFSDDPERDVFLRNDGDLRFSDGSSEAGIPNLGSAMGVAVADIDEDGALDFYVTNIGQHALLWNLGGGAWVDVSAAAGTANDSGAAGWGAVFFDPDDDGRQDLFVTQGSVYLPLGDRELLRAGAGGNRFFQRAPEPLEIRFEERAAELGLRDSGQGMGAAAGDLDGDGRVDLVVVRRSGGIRVFRNLGRAGDAPAPLRLRLLGGQDSNPEAVGARVRARACGRTLHRQVGAGPSVLSQGECTVHVPLDPACGEDLEIEVDWPSGRRESWTLDPPDWGDGERVLREGEG